MESSLYVFLSDGVFLPCDHGLNFDISLCENSIKINGRVFPAGVGPNSPSRDAANSLPSQFSLSVETRRFMVG